MYSQYWLNVSRSEKILLRWFYNENPLGNHILVIALSCLNDCEPIYIVYRINKTTLSKTKDLRQDDKPNLAQWLLKFRFFLFISLMLRTLIDFKYRIEWEHFFLLYNKFLGFWWQELFQCCWIFLHVLHIFSVLKLKLGWMVIFFFMKQ